MNATLFLFDDAGAGAFSPFALSRPVGELFFGAFLLRERAERFWGLPCAGHLNRSELLGFSEPGAPQVLPEGRVGFQDFRIYQTGRAMVTGLRPALPDGPATLFLGDAVVGWTLPPGTPPPTPASLLDPGPLPGSVEIRLEGRILETPWELMAENGDQLSADIPRFFPGYAVEELPGCHILGDGLVSLGSNVSVEPGSVFDVREGPIRLEDEVTVQAHTRLAGPAYVGRGSTILGGVLSAVSLGPTCRIRGEVECSVVLGYTNKAHEGFLGHAYLGKWVNLGAFTTNSDLKNNYGEVRVGGPAGRVATGLMKVGCFLGDHVKTGIGTFLSTGTVIGFGSNVYGGAMPPTYVPPFSWGSGTDLTEYRLDKFLEVARAAMARRNVTLEAGPEQLIRAVWETTRKERVAWG